MTINDAELCKYMTEIHRKHAVLEYLTREGKEQELFMTLSDIERASNLAQNRLNQLRFTK